MNALAAPGATAPTLELIPITSIRPSATHIQTLRREHFDPEKLMELAASIGGQGVLQPILVRPIKPDGTVKFEIVAGERRWRAADRAGLAHVPANVRDMSDEQVLEAQLVENLQREGLRPLEEAEGYRELMAIKGIDADGVAELIGKSRSYVYARRKLLDLCLAGRDALAKGEIDASKALLLARIKGEKLQQRALKLITSEGAWYSYRRLVEKLRADFMIPLAGAPFGFDETLPEKSGASILACIDCPHCSANDPELRAELGLADGAHICTDRACFDLKTKLYWARARRDAEAAGRSILTGDQAKAVTPGQWDEGIKGGHVDLDAPSQMKFPEPEPEPQEGESDEAFQRRESAWYNREAAWNAPTVRQLLGADLPADKTVLAEGKQGRLIELVPVKAVAKLLKAKGAPVPAGSGRVYDEQEERPDPAKAAAEKAKEEERAKVETEYRKRLFKAVFDKWKGPLKLPDFRRIAEALGIDEGWNDGVEMLVAAHGGEYDIEKLKEPELIRLIALLPLAEEAEERYDKPGMLLEAAQRLKIDPKKIRAEVVKDLKPVSAAPEKPVAKKQAKK
jgi:ParB/RepB/Spo0J family partition protein